MMAHDTLDQRCLDETLRELSKHTLVNLKAIAKQENIGMSKPKAYLQDQIKNRASMFLVPRPTIMP